MIYSKYYSDKVILVTGGAGAIGSNLVKKLCSITRRKVIVLDNLSSSYVWNIPDNENMIFVKGDIRNDDDLRRVFHFKPEVVFHLAAFFANQNSVDYPIINNEVNSTGMLKLLEYSVLSGNVQRFVYTNSEGGAYGRESKQPYRENDISLDLSTPYYISKLAGEAYCQFYSNQYKLPVSIVRLFNSYGPGEVPGQYRNVIPNFIYWALQKKALPVTGSKSMARDFVFVDDTIEGILRAGFFDEAIGKAVNIATGNSVNIMDVANYINSKTGNTSGIHFLEKRNWDTRESIIGSTDLMKELLRFEALTDFKDGIDSTIDWFMVNKEMIFKSADFNPGISAALSHGEDRL